MKKYTWIHWLIESENKQCHAYNTEKWLVFLVLAETKMTEAQSQPHWGLSTMDLNLQCSLLPHPQFWITNKGKKMVIIVWCSQDTKIPKALFDLDSFGC